MFLMRQDRANPCEILRRGGSGHAAGCKTAAPRRLAVSRQRLNTSRGARKNSYQVIYRNVFIHGNQHDTESKFVLATDLSCKFSFHDKRVVLCERDPVADESSRSSFTSSLKDKQGADGQQQKVLEFNVSSPELAAAGKIPNNLSRKKGSFKTVIDISQCISLEARS